MPGQLRHLPRLVPAPPARPDVGGAESPIRKVTRQVAFERDAWTGERAEKVQALFDDLAPTWDERPGVGELEALVDALERGGPFPVGPCLEVGSGTGQATPVLASRFSPVVALDLSPLMLARAGPGPGWRVRADGARLPVPSGRAAVVVLVNMFLFPAEVDRVLAPAGALVWVNTLGEATPIHLSAPEVAAALPGAWEGVASDAGWGTWAVLRRASG